MHRPNPTLRRPLGRAFIAFFLVLGLLAGCGRSNEADRADAASDTTDALPPVLETIDDSTYALIIEYDEGGDTLSTEMFMSRLLNFEQQVRMQRPGTTLSEEERRQVRKGIAEEFIQRRLLAGEAARLGLTADPATIETEIDQIVAQNRMESREALEQAMATQGMTLDSLRSLIAEEMLLQMVSEQIVEAAAEPTAEEIVGFSRDQGEEVWAQHILFQGDSEPVAQKAKAILDSAKAGADFFALARRHSEGPSAPNGGDLGYFKKGDMLPTFSEAAFALADSGDVYPELVQTSFGYHVIRLLGRRAAAPIDTSQARVLLTRNRQREAYEKRLNQLRADTIIRINPRIINADLNS